MKLHPVYGTPMVELKSVEEINALRRRRSGRDDPDRWNEAIAAALRRTRRQRNYGLEVIAVAILAIYLLVFR